MLEEEPGDVELWFVQGGDGGLGEVQKGDWESPLGIRLDGLEDDNLDGWIYLKKCLNMVNDAEACLEEEVFLEEDDYDGEECLEYDTLILL